MDYVNVGQCLPLAERCRRRPVGPCSEKPWRPSRRGVGVQIFRGDGAKNREERMEERERLRAVES